MQLLDIVIHLFLLLPLLLPPPYFVEVIGFEKSKAGSPWVNPFGNPCEKSMSRLTGRTTEEGAFGGGTLGWNGFAALLYLWTIKLSKISII